MDTVIAMGYDGKHSYEDAIMPVEETYDRVKGRIAVLGGIDVHFMATATPEIIRKRALSMLEKTATSGGYALGTGNSVPNYIPPENFFAMTSAVLT